MKKDKHAKTLFENIEKATKAITEKAILITTTTQCKLYGYADGSWIITTTKFIAWAEDNTDLEIKLEEMKLT